jgi:hypothetical protein
MKRDKLEIIRNILIICANGGARKTKIMYESNGQLQDHRRLPETAHGSTNDIQRKYVLQDHSPRSRTTIQYKRGIGILGFKI